MRAVGVVEGWILADSCILIISTRPIILKDLPAPPSMCAPACRCRCPAPVRLEAPAGPARRPRAPKVPKVARPEPEVHRATPSPAPVDDCVSRPCRAAVHHACTPTPSGHHAATASVSAPCAPPTTPSPPPPLHFPAAGVRPAFRRRAALHPSAASSTARARCCCCCCLPLLKHELALPAPSHRRLRTYARPRPRNPRTSCTHTPDTPARSRRCSPLRPPTYALPTLAHQQPTFDQAYAGQPAASAKGSWLARVSHRASHIPARTTDLGKSANNDTSHTLPLRSAGLAAVSHERLPSLQKVATAEYIVSPRSPHSPSSPVESDFAPTPIDASFGERIDLPAGGAGLQLANSRSGKSLAGEQAMDRYGRPVVGEHAYDSDADADDEFERSIIASPTVPAHFDDVEDDRGTESEDERESVGGEDTPTTQGWMEREGRSPTGNVAQWTEGQVADYVASLSPALKQYSQAFEDEGVNGEALIALHHDELRELGVSSVGHRLTILKAVYEQKRRSNVRFEEDDYVPLCRCIPKGYW